MNIFSGSVSLEIFFKKQKGKKKATTSKDTFECRFAFVAYRFGLIA